MPIQVIRTPRASNQFNEVVWQVRLVLLPGHSIPNGWDSRRLEYRFETEAAAVAFARLKVEASDANTETALLAISVEHRAP